MSNRETSHGSLWDRVVRIVFPQSPQRDSSGAQEPPDKNAPRCRNCGAVLDYGAVKCDVCGRKTVQFNLR